MSGQGGGTPQDLVVQSWIMYSIGILVFLVRIYAQYKRVGFHFQIEDYLMVVAVCFYTAFVVTNIQIAEGGGSSLYLPGQFETFTAQEIQERITGSKVEFASENCQLCTIYCLKASMLFVYYRITSNLKQQRFVTICATYTFLGWLATELTLFLNCHPLSGYWTLPPPQPECATYFRYEVIQCIFNISSDVAILLVILPLLFRTRMAWRTKIPVLIVFSMGIVVILCAIISKYFTFHNIYDSSYQFWYLREASIGMYVTNAPLIWALVRSMVSFLKSPSNATDGKYNSHQYGTNRIGNPRSKPGTDTRSTRVLTRMYDNETRGESEEHIMEMGRMGEQMHTSAASTDKSDSADRGRLPTGSNGGKDKDTHICKTTEIVIERS
ncbi:hypothetical protein N7486_005352 [Penicillium sp. IBT 16267x]|nr:hypothetical protein N7486_005352 [Penicillium sp. IBT 16267x]